MDQRTDRSKARAETLRRLADDHALSPNARTATGEHLGKDLSAPERLGAWCAVSYSPADEGVHLYPHFETAAAAREFAACLLEDPSFAELPFEVISLDDGRRQLARLEVVSWDSPRR
jgi:hypothetical protein